MRLLLPSLLLAVGVGCATDGSLTINDADDPPNVTLVSPTEGQVFVEGDSVSFEAVVHDAETPLDALELVWSSTLGGALAGEPVLDGDRVHLVLDALAPGEQTVTLQAIDAQGQSAEDSVRVVVEANLPPTVDLLSPVDGTSWIAGSPVSVEAIFADDHAAPGALALAWGDAAAGAPGAPTNPDATGRADFTLTGLAPGSYTVSVVVTDPSGLSASLGADFDVIDGDLDDDGHVDEALGGDDCDDTDADVHPGAAEICNEADDDCDGLADEGLPELAWYHDADGDGFGTPASLVRACAAPPTHVAQTGDCDDTDADVHPGAAEVCNGVDDDCTGGADDGLAKKPWYYDGDADGYGQTSAALLGCSGPEGYVAAAGDCDDADGAVHPGAKELCNGVDDDCKGGIDDGLALVAWYLDADLDGWGLPSSKLLACEGPPGRIDQAGDCDDGDPDVNPDADEVCNGADDDCAGGVDDGLPVDTWYVDADGDDYGGSTTRASCGDPGPGWTDAGGDCNDAKAGVNPDADEICGNGIDEDCTGTADDGCVYDYNGYWDITPDVSDTCYWGYTSTYALKNNFSGFSVSGVRPSVKVVTGGNPDGDAGGLTGTFDGPNHFQVTSHVENYGTPQQGFDEDYLIDVTFTSATTLKGYYEQDFEITPANRVPCRYKRFDFTGKKL